MGRYALLGSKRALVSGAVYRAPEGCYDFGIGLMWCCEVEGLP